MAIRKILYAPNPILNKIAEPVDEITPEIKTLYQDMLETMHTFDGIGLAAPQIGISKRVIVIDIAITNNRYPVAEENQQNDDDDDDDNDDDTISMNEKDKPFIMINPQCTWYSEQTNDYEEGCLSLPTTSGIVTRPKIVQVEYLDENGIQQKIKANRLLATCIQHEIDHLDGKLYIDNLSKLKRNIILKKLKKYVNSLEEN